MCLFMFFGSSLLEELYIHASRFVFMPFEYIRKIAFSSPFPDLVSFVPIGRYSVKVSSR